MSDPLNPSASLLSKLGSFIVHVEEFLDTGHEFDRIAAKSAREDEEVEEWMHEMQTRGLLPLRRG